MDPNLVTSCEFLDLDQALGRAGVGGVGAELGQDPSVSSPVACFNQFFPCGDFLLAPLSIAQLDYPIGENSANARFFDRIGNALHEEILIRETSGS